MTTRIVSQYRVLERLGAGGLGEVYRAIDLKPGRIVALKFLSPGVFTDDQTEQRLLTEAQAAAALNHPHVATIYEVGQADSLPYIAMEYVEGETLTEELDRGPLEPSAAIALAIQIAEALAAAHTQGLIHCDIKSSNIMITPDGRAKVLDFGLALFAEEQITNAPDAIAGTVSYMSPEQVQREPLDARTDLFSLGVVLYEMTAGRRPFEGESQAGVLHAILCDEPPPLRVFRDDVPLELESIVRKALEKNRDERYQSADEMLTDLIRLRTQLDQPQRHRDSNNNLGRGSPCLRASVAKVVSDWKETARSRLSKRDDLSWVVAVSGSRPGSLLRT